MDTDIPLENVATFLVVLRSWSLFSLFRWVYFLTLLKQKHVIAAKYMIAEHG